MLFRSSFGFPQFSRVTVGPAHNVYEVMFQERSYAWAISIQMILLIYS